MWTLSSVNSHFFSITHWGPFILSLVPSTKLYGIFITDSQMSLSLFQERYFLKKNAIDRFNYMQLEKNNNRIGKAKYIEFDVFGCKNFHLAKTA